ncbi:HAD family hydrolase [Faecalimonas sp.]
MVKALLFDMDGLVFDSEKVVQRSWNMAGNTLGYGDIGNHIYNTLGMNAKSRDEYFKGVFGEEFPNDQFRDLARENFYTIVEKEGLTVKPGARELIFYAKQLGQRTAVVSSSRKPYVEEMFKRAGLYEYFDTFVCGDMVEKSKPDPEIYEKACKQLGVKPEYCIAFEDAPAGVESAAAAGVYVIMVPDLVQPDQQIRNKAWMVIDTLEEAIDILRREARE